MEIFMVILVSILGLAAIAISACVITDRILIVKKLKVIKAGMTGHQVQDAAKCKLRFISVYGDCYYAQLISPLKFYKYNLKFKNGKLKDINRM